ncbi:F0F1 ATP synthase subunit B [Nesterenkonia flava]|uniref:ATP synthase subunit b n=1 Tax=Nesterenkonia flava TaxID=469799 RepID=A0ABU1FS26_9MICC|nr:F0F1 ATP synthase subunit B [Nesterenkonia flava]MDR5711470.1 F0F1 ATP synthase subunit B [Nesterenkonia flava]
MISTALIHAAEDGEYTANPLIPHPWEMAAAFIGFFVLLFVVIKFVVPKFEATYQARVAAIEGGINEAEEAKAEAEALKSEYEKNLADSRAEASSIREEARTEAAQIVAEAQEKASAEAARIREQAHAQIEAERAAAAASLKADVGSLATKLAGQIVGEALEDDARSQRVVDRFLADLDAEQNKAGAAQ